MKDMNSTSTTQLKIFKNLRKWLDPRIICLILFAYALSIYSFMAIDLEHFGSKVYVLTCFGVLLYTFPFKINSPYKGISFFDKLVLLLNPTFLLFSYLCFIR